MPGLENWQSLSFGSSLEESPTAIAAAPVMDSLDLLPFNEMTWENFEKLLWQVMRDVEGLREALIYGERGQAQFGLDVVAWTPGGSAVALQSKRYKRFGPADLKAAVEKFQTTERPFEVERLIIAVGRKVQTTEAAKMLATLQRELAPIRLDLWDSRNLSEQLRDQPSIVIRFFGMPTAVRFCDPFTIDPLVVPTGNAVVARDALARTPEVATGAADLLRQAEVQSTDPAHALSLIEAAQTKLREAGFGGHAAQHEATRARLLVQLGRGEEAVRSTLDRLWFALDQGLTGTAQSLQRELHELAQTVTGSERSRELDKVPDAAMHVYFHPLGDVPETSALLVGDPIDRARLGVLAGETELANDRSEWLADAQETLSALQESIDDPHIRTRLRLLVAEADGDWRALLADARTRRLGDALNGLVTARYARRCALNQEFELAEGSWAEAAGDACLAQRWTDAYRWVFSRRAFRGRWRPFTSDELLPLQLAMRDMGPASTIVPIDEQAYEGALDGLRRGNLRSAAISAQRALRDAVATADWPGEEQARRVLASVLGEVGELQRSARHLARAGDVNGIKKLAEANSLTFIDSVTDLAAPNYWTVGTTYQLLAVQVDLVPDSLVGQIADHVLEEFASADDGRLIDLRGFNTSRYQGAHKALAGIAHRLTERRARLALQHFKTQPAVDSNHYRYHDEDEAVAVARIARSRPRLRRSALHHLIPLLARSQSARNGTTLAVVDEFFEAVRSLLEKLAAEGNQWAQQVIAAQTSEISNADATEGALTRLTTPLEHVPGVFTSGTSGIPDSVFARNLPAARRIPAIEELFRRANDPLVGSNDRCEYLIAVSNLVTDLRERDRVRFLAAASQCATNPTPSEHDAFERQFGHQLGAVHFKHVDRDIRNRAIFLAAHLVKKRAERANVRNLAFALLGDGTDSDRWAAEALRDLGLDTIKGDVGSLVSHGWAPRSLAGILWVKYGKPEFVGQRLARDPDVRVRRALARAMAGEPPEEFHQPVRALLEQDPCYSVRTTLHTADDN
ncbi:hypothetical protein OHA18_41450 [Kribbella sp. NBC_00709]|uniref:hypothetical protein n=1 Tax=Kribbella sp. NBC_00709 TaxID=2975972 RepID=UPI002E2C6A68|nr:hypothetical protein [Kribbella sp. NBC_00709]